MNRIPDSWFNVTRLPYFTSLGGHCVDASEILHVGEWSRSFGSFSVRLRDGFEFVVIANPQVHSELCALLIKINNVPPVFDGGGE